MKPISICIFVEHAARELDIACALKYLIEKKYALSVEISPVIVRMKEAFESFSPKVVAVPFFYFREGAFIKDIVNAWPKVHYVNLAYEQVFRKIQLPMKIPRDEFAKKGVTHLAWGEFYAQFLKENGVTPKNIVMNGNLSHELYRAPYRDYFTDKKTLAERYGLDAKKKWVLIPENYGSPFHSDSVIRNFIQRGYSEVEAYQNREFETRSLREVILWLEALGNTGEHEVILRPRPPTPKAMMLDACEKTLGKKVFSFHVIKDETVREWILASDSVLSSYSTTLMEAAVAQKNVAMLKPFPFPAFLETDWFSLVPSVTSLKEIQSFLANEQREKSYLPLERWATKTMRGGRDSILNMANFLSSKAQDENSRTTLFVDKVHLNNPGLPPPPQTELLYVPKAGSKPVDTHEEDRFTQEDIDARVARWSKILIGKI